MLAKKPGRLRRELRGPSLGRPLSRDEGRTGFGRDRRGGSSRVVVVSMVVASLAVITVDAAGGQSSAIDPARRVVAGALGPVETGTASAVRPFTSALGYFTSNDKLRGDVARLSAQNSELRSQAERVPLDRNRLAELDGLTRTANQTGYALVAARVVGHGPDAVLLPHRHHRRRHLLGDPPQHDGAQQRRPRRPGDQRLAQHRRRAAHRRHRLGRRRSTRLQQRDRLPARPRSHRRPGSARPRHRRQLGDPQQGRRRGHLGQPERRPLRRRHPDRLRRVRLLQPPRARPARRDRPLRRLHRPRRRRCRRTPLDQG